MNKELYTALALLTVAAITILLRAAPFLLFGRRSELPSSVRFLGTVLPQAIMAILVIYCLRHIQPGHAPHGVPELVALAVVTALHLWRRNTLLSIATGTAVYMILIRMFIHPA